MKIPLVDLNAQYKRYKSPLDGAVRRVVNSQYFVGGEEVDEFEKAWADRTGADYCIAVDSGTSALELALFAHGIGEGDKVAVPALTFAATAEAVINVGATPVFLDTTAQGHISATQFITLAPKLDAVIVVHLYGVPHSSMSIMRRYANSEDVCVIEDAAQAHGSRYIESAHDGKPAPVGSYTTACWSFYPGKTLGAYGDGGAVTTSSQSVAQMVRLKRDHGRVGKYNHVMVGTNSRMDELQAAVLRAKERFLDDILVQRRRAVRYYQEKLVEFGNDGLISYAKNAYNHIGWHLFPTFVKNRDSVVNYMRERGVGVGIHYPEILPHTPAFIVYKEEGEEFVGPSLSVPSEFSELCDSDIDSWNVAYCLSESEMSLPLYPEITTNQQNYVLDILWEALNECC
jgi:dTDP-4-amino-4,6-dideoxygalactose transaminase